MTKLFLALSMVFAGLNAQAFSGKCEEANLTDAQKHAIHELMNSKKSDMKETKESLKRNFRALHETVLDENSSIEDADELAGSIRVHLMVLGTYVSDITLEILYNIADFEQRAPLLECMRKHKEGKKPGDGGLI